MKVMPSHDLTRQEWTLRSLGLVCSLLPFGAWTSLLSSVWVSWETSSSAQMKLPIIVCHKWKLVITNHSTHGEESKGKRREACVCSVSQCQTNVNFLSTIHAVIYLASSANYVLWQKQLWPLLILWGKDQHGRAIPKMQQVTIPRRR